MLLEPKFDMSIYVYPGLSDRDKLMMRLGRKVDNIDDILSAVCEVLDVPIERLLSPSREKAIAEARTIAVGLILQVNSDITLKSLGRRLNRHYSSVIHQRETYNDLYKLDKLFTKKVNKVLEKV